MRQAVCTQMLKMLHGVAFQLRGGPLARCERGIEPMGEGGGESGLVAELGSFLCEECQCGQILPLWA